MSFPFVILMRNEYEKLKNKAKYNEQKVNEIVNRKIHEHLEKEKQFQYDIWNRRCQKLTEENERIKLLRKYDREEINKKSELITKLYQDIDYLQEKIKRLENGTNKKGRNNKS